MTGGKAIELFCGHQVRDHLDLDIEILRSDATRLGTAHRQPRTAQALGTKPAADGQHPVGPTRP